MQRSTTTRLTAAGAATQTLAPGFSQGASAVPGTPALRPTLREIFDAYAPYLHRVVVGLGIRPGDAEDVCQEVLLIVNRRLGDFRGTNLRAWIYGIAVRVASDHRNRAHVRRELPTDTLPERTVDAAQDTELERRRAEQRLLGVLDELDEDKRTVFVLYEIEEFTLKEIAEIAGCPLQTAYSRLQVARQRVRDAFASAGSGRNLASNGVGRETP